jgi:hypothetical protein
MEHGGVHEIPDSIFTKHYSLRVKLSFPCAFFNRAPRHGGVLRNEAIPPHIIDLGTRLR